MQSLDTSYSTNGKVKLDLPVGKRVSPALVDEIIKSIKSVSGFGSVEIYIQDFSVTQITTRSIKKTKHFLAE